MPSLPGRPTSAEHQAAVSRRLELLRAELSGAAGPHPAAEPLGDDARRAGDLDGSGGADQDPWWSSATRVPGARLHVVPPAGGDDPRTEAPGVGPATAPPDGPPEHVFGPAPWVPVPGRHASRRDRAAPGWLPETLRGRVALGSTQLTVVAVLVAVGLAITAWSVVRASPEPLAVGDRVAPVSVDVGAGAGAGDGGQLVELPAETTGGAGATGTAATGATAAEAAVTSAVSGVAGAPVEVTVDVAGKVRRPGIAVLPPGARVIDALAAAGGARAGVDLTSLNLARLLVDGEQILVGVPLPAGAAASALAQGGAALPAGASPAGALVNLNTATEADLDTLPDVGPVTAQSIIAWRAEHGGFSGVDELLEVDGIGEATLSRLAPLVTV